MFRVSKIAAAILLSGTVSTFAADYAPLTDREQNRTAINALPKAALPLSPDTYETLYGPRTLSLPRQGDCALNQSFKFGAAIHDTTGPIYGQVMAGYANPVQVSEGLHNRQFARAFIIGSNCADQDQRAVLVSVDLGLMFHAIRQGVVDKIKTDPSLAPYYNYNNVMITPTHSHATAAGQAHHDLYNLPAFGFDEQAHNAVVSGIFNAIKQAHLNFEAQSEGRIMMAQGELLNATVQRSLPAYIQNPTWERADWIDVGGNPVTINRNMLLLKLIDEHNTPIAMLNWFGIHGTSMSNLNRHLSSDNKGYAAWRFERAMNGDKGPSYFQEDTPFVAGFFQGDEGDASPNIHITPLSEDILRDPASPEFAVRGGGKDDLESTEISGLKQYERAQELFEQANSPLMGPVRAMHSFIDFTAIAVEPEFHNDYDEALDQTGARRTCEPAYGMSAPAGAEDGRAPLDEGMTCANTGWGIQTAWKWGLWSVLQIVTGFDLPSGLASKVGCEHPVNVDDKGDFGCHAEKPIAAPLGHAIFDPEQPIAARVIPMQIIQIGDLAIIALPFEVTTMAARRIRTALLDELEPLGIRYAQISGLSNHYSHYLTTREEYAVQHYEGGSTVFGAWQLDAVIQELSLMVRRNLSSENASAQNLGTEILPARYQDDYRTHVTSLVHDPDMENHFDNDKPGTLREGPEGTFSKADNPAIIARFVTQNPRADLHQNTTYGQVETLSDTGEWVPVALDNDWSLHATYDETDGTLALTWRPDEQTGPGTYRIRLTTPDSATQSFTLTN